MENQTEVVQKPIYKRKWFLITVGIIVVIILLPKQKSVDDSNNNSLDDSSFNKNLINLDSGIVENVFFSTDLDGPKTREFYQRIKLDKIKAGHTFYFGDKDFGSGGVIRSEQKIIKLINDSTAKVICKYRWAMNSDTNMMREAPIEEGEYKVSRVEGSQVRSDNQYYPIFDKILLLQNNNYGFDKGYKLLPKCFCIGKDKPKDSETGISIRLYEWLDPINYPSRKGEFSFNGSREVFDIQKSK